MAWVAKYQVGNYDLGGVPWTVIFHFDGYAGPVTTLKGGGSPIQFEFQNGSDDIFDPWHPSQIKVSIEIQDNNFALADELYSVEQMHCYVEVFQGNDDSSAGVPYWVGYVDPSQLSEPYDVLPYNLEVTCVNGLSLLEQIPFYDTIDDLIEDSGEPYNNRITESQILFYIFGKIGYTEFKEFINLYEVNMNDTVDDSPMDQLKIDVDVFQGMMCSEVFKHLLAKYNAWIRQIDGVFNIFRPVTLKNATIYGRWFTSVTEYTSISHTPEYFISRRDTHLTTLKQVPGGQKNKVNPARKVRLNFDYGNKASWIDNYELKAETWTGTTFEFWTAHSHVAGDILPFSDIVKGEEGAYLRIISGGDPSLQQGFGDLALQGSDFIVLEFDYALYNHTASTITGIVVSFRVQQDSHYLYANGTWVAQSPGHSIDSAYISAEAGFNDFVSFRLEIPSLPSNGILYITLYATNSSDVGVVFKNIRFYVTSTKTLNKQVKTNFWQRYKEVHEKGLSWMSRGRFKTVDYRVQDDTIIEHIITKQNNIHGEILDYDYILGDVPNVSNPVSDADVGLLNILSQFGGALSLDTTRYSLPDTAKEFYDNHRTSFSPSVVTYSGATIIFTAGTAGVDFSAAAAIVNATGNLSGTASTTTPNGVGTPQVTRLDIGGSSGYIDIYVGIHVHTMNWDSGGIAATIDAFIAYEGAGAYPGKTLSRGGSVTLEITGDALGTPFTVTVNENGLTGTENGSTAPTAAIKRVDHIVLTGTSGTATVSCDGDSATATVQTTSQVLPTTLWHEGNAIESSGESDYLPLLDIIGNEIAEQYSRPKDFIQMPLQNTGTGESAVNLLDCFVDELNLKDSGINLMTDPDGSADNYTNMTISGIRITQAVNAGGSVAVRSNTFYVNENDIIKVSVVIGLTSGQLPFIYLSEAGDAISEIIQLKQGQNIVYLTANQAMTATFDISNALAADWNTSNIEIYLQTPKQFVASRGGFDERNRKWELDLIELI